jgi:hypothetical protein
MCQVPACGDTVRNGNETDVDCGGNCDGCDDGLACGVDGDCSSGQCSNNVCVSGPDYEAFGQWTTVVAGNLGGSNVPIDWADGLGRTGWIGQGRQLDIRCGRPPSYWEQDNPNILTNPVLNRVYYRANSRTWGMRYLGPCAGEPQRRSITHVSRRCVGNGYLRVRHTSSFPLVDGSRLTHEGICYEIYGFVSDDFAQHFPVVTIEDVNRFTPP